LESLEHLSHIRPRFTYLLEKDRSAVEQRIQEVAAGSGLRVTTVDHHIIVDIPIQERHFWSPQLHFRLEQEGNQVRVHGLMGPRPAVWTGFMFFYFSMGIAGAIATTWGLAHWMLNGYSPMIWGLPVAFVIMATAYGAGRVGESLGRDQVMQLKAFLAKALDLPGIAWPGME
jgi:hypothetical protein